MTEKLEWRSAFTALKETFEAAQNVALTGERHEQFMGFRDYLESLIEEIEEEGVDESH